MREEKLKILLKVMNKSLMDLNIWKTLKINRLKFKINRLFNSFKKHKFLEI